MIGNNKIILNRATMMEALEEYLNKRKFASPALKVTDIDKVANTTTTFTVSFVPREEDLEEQT